MMVKVWNDNTHTYREMFREKDIEIKPKTYIEMELNDAHLFLGTYAPMKFDGDGNPIPSGFKMLRIEEIRGTPAPQVKLDTLTCQACKHEADTEAEMQAHVKEAHADSILVDEVAEEAVKAKRTRKS